MVIASIPRRASQERADGPIPWQVRRQNPGWNARCRRPFRGCTEPRQAPGPRACIVERLAGCRRHGPGSLETRCVLVALSVQVLARQEVFLCDTSLRPTSTCLAANGTTWTRSAARLAELGRRSCGAGVARWLNATVPLEVVGDDGTGSAHDRCGHHVLIVGVGESPLDRDADHNKCGYPFHKK